jgi:hypothetical protein
MPAMMSLIESHNAAISGTIGLIASMPRRNFSVNGFSASSRKKNSDQIDLGPSVARHNDPGVSQRIYPII